MVIEYNEISNVLTKFAEDEDIRITVKQSAKGGLIAGFICALGGLIAGPVGLIFGGTAGGIVAAYFSGESFLPVATIINEMDPERKKEMTNSVIKIINKTDAMDALEILAIIQGNNVIKAKVRTNLINICQQQLT